MLATTTEFNKRKKCKKVATFLVRKKCVMENQIKNFT